MGEDLEERFEHLTLSFRSFYSVTGTIRKKVGVLINSAKLMAHFIPLNTPTTKKTKQWHPHIHIFFFTNQWIDQEELAETWHDITP